MRFYCAICELVIGLSLFTNDVTLTEGKVLNITSADDVKQKMTNRTSFNVISTKRKTLHDIMENINFKVSKSDDGPHPLGHSGRAFHLHMKKLFNRWTQSRIHLTFATRSYRLALLTLLLVAVAFMGYLSRILIRELFRNVRARKNIKTKTLPSKLPLAAALERRPTRMNLT